MKKYWSLVLVLAAFQLGAQAQVKQNKNENQWISVGVKGGVGVSRMMYRHNESLGRLPQNTVLCPACGFFADIPLNNAFSVAPEVMYVRRGTGLHYRHVSGAEVNYSLDVTYVDLRLPLEIRWHISSYVQPYLLVGAEAGLRLGGFIHMTRTAPIALDQTIEVGEANMALFHAGAFAGAGILSKLELNRRDLMLKLSLSYHQGLIDTYSPMEKNGAAEAQNVNAYQVDGQRLPQSLELAFGVAVSLDRRDDACATFSGERFRRKSNRGRLFGF